MLFRTSRRPNAVPLLAGLTAALLAAPPTLGEERDDDAGFQGGGALFIVSTLADTPDANPGDGICADADGACSLRAAVQEANALGGSATIRLAQNATYVLSLAGTDEDGAATGDLDVTADILIRGRGATVDAAQLDRAFDVLAGGALEVRDLTVRNGAVIDANGGGYRSAGMLVLRSSAVHDCVATGAGASGGAISNEGGSLAVRSSTLSDNSATRAGGAIEAVAGTTLVRQSEMLDNVTGPGPGNGGALHLTGAGDVTVRQTHVAGNVAAREGGGLWNSAVGTMTVRQCTVEDNEANGSAADDGGGGLFNDGGAMTVVQTMVLGNRALFGSGSGGGIFNNGGDLTVRNTTIEGNASNRAGGGIEVVAGTTAIDASRLAENTTGASPGNGGGLHLTGAGTVTVDGTDVEGNTAAAEGGGLWNSAVGTMTISDCAVSGNVASGAPSDQGGGGLFNDGGVMTVTSSSITGNTANGTAGSGGGAFNNGGTLDVSATNISGNASRRAGGGIEALGGTTTIDNSSMSQNETGPAPGNGGALHLTGSGTVTVSSTRVASNTATAEGGGLWNSAGGIMTIDDCVIMRNAASGNDADQGGGGLFNEGGVMDVFNTVIRRNDADGASGSGGGVFNNQGQLLIVNCLLSRNSSSRAGGGIEANAGMTTLDGVILLLNATGASPGNGGGLHLTGPGVVDVFDGLVFLNFAANEGGGLWNSGSGTMTVEGTAIFLNTAPTGPNVFNVGGTFTIDGDPVPAG